jgi:hypothetical protein
MSHANPASGQAPPPHVQLIQMATAYWVSRLLYAVAKLRVPDHLADGPATAESVASKTGSHAPTLYRVMRTLASLGVFTEDGQRRFALTPLGQALRSGAPGSAHATVLTLAGDWAWKSFEEVLHSIETGQPGFEKAFGEPPFDWMGKNPEQAALFNETMIGFHGEEPAAVAAAYDFSSMQTIVDVGGGTGNLLTTVVAKHTHTRGILFDLPHVTREAPALIEARGLADRITVETGSFFDSVPRGGSAYMLSHVIHDWSETQCLTILENCRRAMDTNGRLLMIEMVLPPGDTPHPGKLLDMMMLLAPGGQERTEEEYRALLHQAGFRLTRTVPTQSAVSVVEAVPN